MSNYYFLSSLLPALSIGEPSPLPFNELEDLLEYNLSKDDYEKVVVLRRMIDIENIRQLWRENPVDIRGNLSDKELEESLLVGEGLPNYVYRFLERYHSIEERLHYFSHLVRDFYVREITVHTGFLQQYMTFEREWRLVMLGFRAKQLGKDVSSELQFEDPYDTIVAQIIAQKDSKRYDPPERYGDLKALFEELYDKPLKLHKALNKYRFQYVGKMIEGDFFSIDRVFGFFAQFLIVEKWIELDEQEGKVIINNVLKALK